MSHSIMKRFMPSLAIIQAAAVHQPLDNPIDTVVNGLWNTAPADLTNPFEAFWLTTASLKCDACKLGSWTIRETIGRKHVQNLLTDLVIGICAYVIEDAGFKREVCPGIIKQQFGDSILPILTDQLADETTMCSYIFNVCDMEKYIMQDLESIVFDTLQKKPALAATNDYVNSLYRENEYLQKPRTTNKDYIKIALISDLHMDFDYTPGMSNDCGKPLCCRSDSGLPQMNGMAAGKWGDFKCDLNQLTLENMLEYISEELKPDVVFWGGDSVPHNVDSLTFDSNVEIMKNTTKIVSDGLDGFRVYPTIGNHDTYPQDIIAMNAPRDNAAIQEWSPEWLQWIPDEEQQKNFLDWGYYSLDLTGINGEQLGKKKTKVISLNTNICYRFNWETLNNFNDPGNMLDWLSNELSALEAVNGTAIIIAHVPNIDECTRQFGRRYHALMDRYQTVIRWGMYSHIHQEQYQVARDVYEHKSIGMNFIVGSATTYMGKPPSFNVMYLDPDTMLPIDYETIAFDLDHANEFDEPIWERKYNYRDTYNLKDLSPQSFLDHSYLQIQRNETAAMEYRNHRYIDGPGVNLEDGCDWSCRMIFYCQTVANEYDEWQYCRENALIEFGNGEGILSIEDMITHNWFVPKK